MLIKQIKLKIVEAYDDERIPAGSLFSINAYLIDGIVQVDDEKCLLFTQLGDYLVKENFYKLHMVTSGFNLSNE